MERERIVAIGLLTETNIRMLGSSLKKVFPITDDGRFDTLLQALDKEYGQTPGGASGNAKGSG